VSGVFITGAAGFIGSNLTDAYLAAGWDVVGLDDLSTGSRENLAAAAAHPHFRLVVGDVCNDALVGEAMANCDVVVHLAARIGLRLVIDSPLQTLESNVKGTEVVIKHAAARKLRTIVASTSEVYGLTTRIPSHEDDPITFGSPAKGRWSYACSKAYDEFLALANFRENGLPATVVRLFNTVGARQTGRYGMVLPRFVRQALAGEPLTVYGDGRQTRCFGSVRDVVRVLIQIANEPNAIGEVINLGNPEEIEIVELARRVIALTSSTSSIAYVPFDDVFGAGFEEIQRRVPDITKARALLGFEPRVHRDEIIRDVIAQFATGTGTLVRA
jgi:UDP-glucose 4-epimerase